MTLHPSADANIRSALAARVKADIAPTALGTPSTTGFALQHVLETGFARFTDGRISLVRFRSGWPWEFSTVTQTGKSRGLEMFVRYLQRDEAARVELALETECARQCLEAAGKSVYGFLAVRGHAVDVITGRLVD